MLLARTDPEVPKHQGISYFAFEMLQDGVDVRPLKEMTGHALFNEVFITDARVADSALIGGVNNGWAAANTTLMNERAGLGSGGGNAAGGGLAQPGTVMGFLGKRVGDVVAPAAAGGAAKKSDEKSDRRTQQPGGALSALRGGAAMLIGLAQSRGVNTDAGIRQDLARLYTLGELGRFNGLRVKAVKEQGGDIPGMPNVAKLSMSQIVRLTRDLGLRIAGPAGMLHAYDSDDKAALKHGDGRPLRRKHHRDGAVRAGASDLRRDRPGAAQHHRGAGPGAAQGAQQRPGDALLPAAQERLAVGTTGAGRGRGVVGMSRGDRTLRGAAAIVGVADDVSPTGELDRSGRELEVAMILDALEDAGLTLADVDGVCHAESAVGLAEYLGIHPTFTESTMTGGSSYEVHLEHAAAAIAAGLCDVVVSVYAATPRGDRRRGRRARAACRRARTRWPNGRCPTACACRWAPTRSPPPATCTSSAPPPSSSPRSPSARGSGPPAIRGPATATRSPSPTCSPRRCR